MSSVKNYIFKNDILSFGRIYNPWISIVQTPYHLAGNHFLLYFSSMIIFVNGFTFGCKPFRPYWSSSKEPDEFIHAAIKYFNDEHVFEGSFINGSGDWFGSMAWSRQASGRKFALEYAKRLDPIKKQNETLKFVTHSMGAAFAEGMIETLVSEGFIIEKVIHFAPAHAKDIRIHPSGAQIDRIQINAAGDTTIEKIVSPFTKEDGFRIPGVRKYGKVQWDPWKYHKNYMDYITKKEFPFDLDAHYDLKTYAYVFDWVKDLESLELQNPIATREYGQKKRNIYTFEIGPFAGTRFINLFLKGRYFQFLEPYENGKTDKFKGPKILQ